MGKFVAVHTVGANLDPEAAAPLAKAIKAKTGADAYWIRSWYLPEEGKFYCEWDAKSPDTVREICESSVAETGVPFPIDGVYAIALQVSGEDYR